MRLNKAITIESFLVFFFLILFGLYITLNLVITNYKYTVSKRVMNSVGKQQHNINMLWHWNYPLTIEKLSVLIPSKPLLEIPLITPLAKIDEAGRKVYFLPVKREALSVHEEPIFYLNDVKADYEFVKTDDYLLINYPQKKIYLVLSHFPTILRKALNETVFICKDSIRYKESFITELKIEKGFGVVEPYNGGFVQWGMGPVSVITFTGTNKKILQCELTFMNPQTNQRLDIYLNGHLIESFLPEFKNEFQTVTINGEVQAGNNQLEIHYANWSRETTGDTRAMAILYKNILLKEKP